jgi:NADPH2:quinone reductase
MLHRSAHIESGESVLIHGGAGGVGTALLQLGKLQRLEMYSTCSLRKQKIVSQLGGKPIDYKSVDFVKEIFRLTNDGVMQFSMVLVQNRYCVLTRHYVLVAD